MKDVLTPLLLVALVAGVCAGGYLVGTRLSATAPAGPVAAAAPARPDGTALFASQCAGCHGAGAVGGVGPRLAGALGAWSGTDFERAVLHGEKPGGGTLAPVMPRFAQSGMSAGDAAAIGAYLKSL